MWILFASIILILLAITISIVVFYKDEEMSITSQNIQYLLVSIGLYMQILSIYQMSHSWFLASVIAVVSLMLFLFNEYYILVICGLIELLWISCKNFFYRMFWRW